MSRRRSLLLLSAAGGGLLAAAFVSTAVAVADQEILVPDVTTFDPTQVTGIAPSSPLEVMGTETWDVFDLSTNTDLGAALHGVDTETTFGSMINDAFAATESTAYRVDLLNFGNGWENEWLEFGSSQHIADFLVTPFGDYTLFGTWPLG